MVSCSKDPLGDHVLTVTQLKDETLMLKRQIQAKDQTIFERDKKVERKKLFSYLFLP